MKLAKLSLAAIVAVGAMTTFASAAPLEEAIKGVDLKGWVRYRVDMNDNGTSNNIAGENHRFSGVFTFTAPVTDEVKSVLTLRYDDLDIAGSSTGPTAASDKNFVVSQAYFQYKASGFTVNVGKMLIGSPWTYNNALDGQTGNGILALYTGVEGWTFAGASFFNTGGGGRVTANNTSKNLLNDDENLYAIAAIGSMGPVNAQVWAGKKTHVFDSVFAELSTKFAGFSLKGQVNHLKLADEVKPVGLVPGVLDSRDDTGLFWAVQAGYAAAGASVNVGYIRTDKDMGIHAVAADHAMIRAGKQAYGSYVNQRDAKTMFVTAGYKFDKYSVGAGYVDSELGSSVAPTGEDTLAKEYYVEAGYAYSKNFSVSTYYSDLDRKRAITENKRFRIEGVYRF
ncbi:major outer membrane protein [Sulfurospirillum sp. T05]|uniref:Major outer membrane protein n=1 Tax=Sulfurospirillum tamanense TaxID=2813362 RepID=A0ABS2WVB7_9BACT|nr:major outer membrane protein [Sulfurospirillum tamanensis]MBN2965590.1 major outer membrane protein [Sulfurospirillum tamanensis]